MPQKHLWQVKFGVRNVAFCLPCCNLTGKRFLRQVACFVHVLHLPRKHIGRCSFCGRCVCLPCFKKQRHQTLNAIRHTLRLSPRQRQSTAILLPLVRFEAWQKKQHDFEQLCRNLQRQAKYYQNFSTKKQPEKVAFVFLFTSLCTAPTLHLPR